LAVLVSLSIPVEGPAMAALTSAIAT
jgi:hypothetical protein